MNIEEMATMKRQVESLMNGLIDDFEKRTGVNVTDVRVEAIDVTPVHSMGRQFVKEIKLKVEL